MSLFPHDQAAAAQHAPQGHDNLLAEFKAGLLQREGATMRPDLRKGVVRVERSDDDLVHFIWKERTAAEADVDIIVFPSEAKLVRLPAARCYTLRFEGQSDRDLFFWMQEPKAEQDEARVAAVNSALGAAAEAAMEQATLLSSMGGGSSHPAETPAPAVRPAAAATPMAGVEATPATEAMAPPSAAPAAPHKGAPMHTPGATPAARAGAAGVGLTDLQSILSGMGMPQPGGNAPPTTASVAAAALAQALLSAGAGRGGAADTASLADVMTPDVLMPILAAEGVQERLAPHLPEAHRNSAALMELIGSPQFSAQLASFSRALQSGQIDLAQFGLRAAAGVSVAEFLQEIQNQAGRAEPAEQQPEGGAPPPPPPPQ